MSNVYIWINRQLNTGTDNIKDKVLINKIQMLNVVSFVTCLYMIVPITQSIRMNETKNVIFGIIAILVIIINHLIFRYIKNIEYYSLIFSFVITLKICYALLSGINTPSGMISIGIIIIIILDSTGRKKGSCFILPILFSEIAVLIINIYDANFSGYNNLTLIRFIIAHFFVYILAYSKLKIQNRLSSDLKDEKESKEHLFINIVHDIKSLLTIIHNNVEESSIEYPEIQSIQDLKNNVLRIEQDIIKILSFEKLNKTVNFDNNIVSNLSEITSNLLNAYISYTESNSIRIITDISPDLCGKIDRTSYIRLFNNLFDNAIKYSKSTGDITVSLNRITDNICLTIKDTGIGIPETEIENIFDPYYQAHGQVGNYYGLGIGLTLVKNICYAFGGEIKVESVEKKGSSFTVNIPIGEKSVSTSNPIKTENIYIPNTSLNQTPAEFNKRLKTVLIVEDNIDIRNYLIKCFSGKYNVLIASNGKKALEECYSDIKIDLIISDIIMPIMDGKEFIEELRKDKKFKNIPVIFLTAKASPKGIEEYISLGAVDFISKPFSAKDLLCKVESILSLLNYDRENMADRISNSLNLFVNERFNNPELTKKHKLNKNLFNKHSITKQESRIIKEIYEGLSHKDVSEKMNISIHTVRTHLRNIYKKCNVQNATALLKLFYYD